MHLIAKVTNVVFILLCVYVLVSLCVILFILNAFMHPVNS